MDCGKPKEQPETKILLRQVENHDDHKAKQVDLKGYEEKLIQTHAMKGRTCTTQKELLMDLAKTIAQAAQVQEKPTRLQIIGGLQDLHKDTTPMNFSSSLRDLQ